MKQDFLLEIIKYDELATAFKKSVLDQIARDAARKKLRAEREILTNQLEKAIRKIDDQLYKLNNEEDELYRIVDTYNEEIEDAPYFSKEVIDLLITFMNEYTKLEKE